MLATSRNSSTRCFGGFESRSAGAGGKLKMYQPVKNMKKTLLKMIHNYSPPGRKQALILVSDKRDLAVLANGLQELGFTIVSTGGTASALENAGVSVTKVEELTYFLEMLVGRVKTLHPNIHGGILARRDLDHHMEALNKHGIGLLFGLLEDEATR